MKNICDYYEVRPSIGKKGSRYKLCLKDMVRVSEEELIQFLRTASRNVCSTRKAEEILDLMIKYGDTTKEYQDSRDFVIKNHVRDIQFKKEEMKKVEELKQMMDLLDY